ncbi:MAG: glycoside hydrolase family 2 [Bacteroidales bacterium]|nr:glycoside hydrolase family 2 [Bacteroidales bacterium]
MRTSLRIALAALSFYTFLPVPPATGRNHPGTTERLCQEFADPPREARPLVWWHWMNGNITSDGIRKDLLWMHRSGIAGFHVFDANFSTPQVVERRIEYMSSEWKEVFSGALRLADSLGMEVAMASSPGFSATGGPWVKAEDAMKKLVWREMVIDGGKPFNGPLPEPLTITGPFQDIEQVPDLSYYEDVAVVAARLPDGEQPVQAQLSSSGGSFTTAQLNNGDFSDDSELPADPSGFAWIQYTYPQPVTVKAMTCVVDDMGRGAHAPERMARDTLLVSDDGISFRMATPIYGGFCPCQTFDFEPVTGRHFRWKHANPQAKYLYSRMKTVPAAPTSRIAEFRLHTIMRVNHAEEKGGFASAYDVERFPTPPAPQEDITRETIDLTQHYRDGILNWNAPEGRWRIYRFGASLTGKMNHPASPEATGLEVDKLDPAAWKRYFHDYLDAFREAAGGMMGKRGIRYLLSDSYEAGFQNWSPRLLHEFRSRRGYDAALWLPSLDGVIIRSSEETDRFLWDWRRTIGELYEENYALMSEIVQKDYGMEGCYIEAHANGRTFNADGMSVKRTALYPMSEMWVPGKVSSKDRIPEGQSDIRESASVAHIYGQNRVAAESLTAIGLERQAWTYYPANLKRTADLEFGAGVNRLVIHDSAHQPLDDKFPGLGLGVYGQWFNRHECWAEQAGAWVDYLSRTSYLLQQGRFVADILWFYGENTNITALYSHARPPVPDGYNFDYVNPEALLNEISSENGRLLARSGMEYRLLCIDPGIKKMTLPLLEKLVSLAESGAVVCGPLPESSPSLSDSGEDFMVLLERARACPTFLCGASCLEALGHCGIAPDVDWHGEKDLNFVHRHLSGAEIYWVNNSTYTKRRVQLSFRCAGLIPEIWRPEDGQILPVSWRRDGNRTQMLLEMERDDAFFIVFRKPKSGESKRGRNLRTPTVIELIPVESPWSIEFQPGRGAPESIRTSALFDLSTSPSDSIRYFSGTAVYKTSFTLKRADGTVELDLGEVGCIAEVRINGRACGTLWKEPYKTDISAAVRDGDNLLEIRVTNLWPNRLIGDARLPKEQRLTYSPIPFYHADDPLLPSGLMGPVTLRLMR